MNSQRAQAGFTLVEIIVVTAVVMMLSTVLIVYSGSAREQIALFVEQVKIAQLILRAKSLAITTYNKDNVPCGYGFHVDYSDPPQYYIFRYDPSNCDNWPPPHILDTATIVGEKFTLNPNLRFNGSDSACQSNKMMENVVFFPPEPITKINDAAGGNPSGGLIYICLTTLDGQADRYISVNSAGQIGFEK